jgi:hypothetical protein
MKENAAALNAPATTGVHCKYRASTSGRAWDSMLMSKSSAQAKE